MKRNQLKTYCAPKCMLVHMEPFTLMETSFPSQHNPAQPGGTISGAKQGLLWENFEGEESYSLWKTDKRELSTE